MCSDAHRRVVAWTQQTDNAGGCPLGSKGEQGKTHVTESGRILIVERDAVASAALAQVLSRHGFNCEEAASAEQALALLAQAEAACGVSATGVVIVEQDLGTAGGGLLFIRQLKESRPSAVPIVLSAFRKVESAVQAMRHGAADYLLKPLIEAELVEAVDRAMQRHLLLVDHAQTEIPAVQTQAEPARAFDEAPPTPTGDGEDNNNAWSPMTLALAMQGPEKRILLSALNANGWNRGQTAKQLDINRTTLYKKIRQYRLDEPA